MIIINALAHTENIERLIGDKSDKFSKIQEKAVTNWLKSLYSLKNPEALPNLEPLLFVLVDRICIHERGKLLDFLRDLVNNYSNIKNSSNFLLPKDEINLIISRILYWETISQNFYDISIQDLDSLSNRPSSSTFFCKIKEFHPRRLYLKHPWNEVQVNSLHSVSIRTLFDLVNNPKEPILGHRYFLSSETGPAFGIAILDGHHRVYELYKRFINSQLTSERTNSGSNGDILVLITEKQ